jgi:hemerythrin-like metal-binding protein
MRFITWTVELSVNIESIDQQHRHMVEAINKLAETIAQGAPREEISHAFSEGLELTISHFAYEEELMRNNGYAGFAQHKREHEEFVAGVRDLAHQLASGKRFEPRTIETHFKEWWMKHMKTSDKAYSKFLVAKGVK